LRIELIFPKADLSFGQIAAIDWDLTETGATLAFFDVVVAAVFHQLVSCDCGVLNDNERDELER
jgi:hypothetical protein